MAAALVGGAALGAAFGELLKAVVKARNRALMFNTILKRMESTLKSIIPVIKEIEELNKVLDRPKQEMGQIMEQIKKGEELVLECSGIHWLACWKRPKYAGKLIKLEKSLKSFFEIVMQAQQARDGKETLLEVKDLRMDLKRLDLNVKTSRAHNVNGYIAPLVLPEPLINPIGLEVPLRELKMELFNDKVSMVVLSAPPGCGKTTLAKLLCHDKEVKEHLQRLFQHKGYEVPQSQTDEHLVYHLEQFLKSLAPSAILLILDDIWPESDSLLDKFNFQIPNYKILVTSRSSLRRFGSSYKLKPLNDKDAMTVFCNSAFLQDKSSNIDEDVVKKIVKGCKGFPLALKVVGRSLCGEPEEIWKRKEMELSKHGTIFEDDELINCLQSSLDALDNKIIVKECFMDLCSFPEDQRIPATALIDMWAELYELDEDGVHAIANLHELSNRNLIDLCVARKDASGYYNKHLVMQHDLLRELAIRQSSLESFEKTKRLIIEIRANNVPDWCMEQKQPSVGGRLLSISTDEKFSSNWCNIQAPEVEVLVLNCRTKTYSLPDFLGKMKKLKVLIVTKYGFFPTEIRNFPFLGTISNLKRIRLEKVSIPSFGFTSVQFKNLHKITLVLCNIGQAFSSTSTIQVSDALPNLVEINIDYSNDLVELPVGLCQLVQLGKLSITNCHKLVALPKEIGNLINLEIVRFSGCIELAELPSTIGSLHKLKILDISECSEIRKLPEQIRDLQNLRKLHMIGCSNKIELPPSILELEHLKEVICDEEIANLWEPFVDQLENLEIKVDKEDINLNWLYNVGF
ncbi:hypothetical protein GH714_013761 [Hevea brasiliensis]|uniref:RPW8 domain-containing protein n=1 Tax=Hevea brasiliensis TaxID=3981 RepID=A0A6A6K6G7_HEVBR|nr:hypothetical protein GH714_013761 [Hevea brasiliensis]